MTCLKCRGETSALRIAVDAGGWWSGIRVSMIEIDQCGACGGSWFDGGEWSAYISRRLESATAPAVLSDEWRKILDSKIAECPRCRVYLEKKRRGGVQVDLCGRCGGMWFDGGEYPAGESLTWEETFRRLLLQ